MAPRERCAHGEGARMAKVVLTDYVWDSLDVEHKTLDGLATLVALKTKTPAEFLPEATDCDALLNTYAGPITADVMKQMPRCRIIARYGIGVDTIDLEAATAAGIIVTNNPTYCIEEVAEHTMALLLACARKVPFYERQVRGGRWELPPGKPIFRLVGRTLGLVGFGNIARAVAVRAAAFGLRILYYDPFVQPGQFPAPGEKRELGPLLRESDFVSVHPPLSAETRGMMNDDAFAQMKPTAFLINCARGPIVDTAALVRARRRTDRGLRSRHDRSRAVAEPAPVARPGQRHPHAPRRVVQRAGDGGTPGGRAERGPPRPHRRVARERRQPRGEREESRGALVRRRRPPREHEDVLDGGR